MRNTAFFSLVLTALIIFQNKAQYANPVVLLEDIPVFDLVMDTNNILWIATENGLMKYDSKNFTHYRFDLFDSLSLSDNSVRSLFIDKNNNVWVGTRNGLNLYNRQYDNFKQYLPNNASNLKLHGGFIKSIAEDSIGHIWIATENHGLNRLNPNTNTFDYTVAGNDFANISSNNLEKIMIDQRGGLWAASRNGLNYLEPGYQEWSKYLLSPDKMNANPVNDIVSIELNEQGDLWVFSRNNDISLLRKNGQIESFETSSEITATHSNASGKIFWGTRNGEIFMLPPQTTSLEKREIFLENDSKIGAIRSIYSDPWENLWIGSENGLFVIYNLNKQFSAVNETPNGQKLTHVMTMLQDHREKIWVSSEKSLYIWQNRKWLDAVELFKNGDPFKAEYVYKLYQDSKNMIWIGTFDQGMYRFDPANNHLKHYQWSNPDDQELTGVNSVWDIKEDRNGNFWIGTWGGGLVFYNTAEETFTRYLANIASKNTISNNKILALHIDSDGIVWIATDGGGLNSYNPEEQNFTHHIPGITENPNSGLMLSRSILCFHEDKTGKIWIGSDGGGLFRYDKTANKFTIFNHNHGLVNQSIKMIIEDEQGFLWISTNGGGIFMFDPQKENFIRFTDIDGLSTNRFHNGSGFTDTKGNIYFGGQEGFTWFHPGNIKTNNFAPNIVVTRLSINNKPRNNKNENLATIINQKKQIRLKPYEKFLTLDFAAVEYSISRRNYYRYRILGLNDEWTNLYQTPSVSLMNIPTGRYNLELQSSNSDGVWIDNAFSIQLIVLPPFYKTPWFIILVIIFLLVAVYAIYIFNIRKIKAQQILLEKKVAQRTEKIELQAAKLEKQNKILVAQQQELTLRNQKIIDSTERIRKMTKKIHEDDIMKLNFFTKVSHEIRTPLTLIIGPLENLMKIHANTEGKTLNYIKTIKNNAENILKLFEQIVDFRKTEGGQMKVTQKTGNISDFLLKLSQSYEQAAAQKNIELKFHSDPPNIQMDFDEDILRKVFSNLLQNAIKFTGHGGHVSLKIKLFIQQESQNGENTPDYSNVKIWVNDTGIGIPEHNIEEIFDRFYQVGEKAVLGATAGVGIGLSLAKELIELHNGKINVESEVGIGTTFCVVLPLENEQLKRIDNKSQGQQTHLINKQVQYSNNNVIDTPIDSIDSEKKSLPENPKNNKKTILVIEDNDELLNYLSDWLAETYNIITAINGQKGLQLAKQEQPDIIISDVIMPVMDGFEFLKNLKADIEISHIPVILLTAKVSIEDRITGIGLAADAYIDKPFHLKHLSVTIESLLENRRIVQRKYRDIFNLEPTNTPVTSPDEIFLKKTREVIESNISNPDFNVDQLSREVGVSRAGIYRKLKALTDLSVNIMIRNMRIKRAAQILSQNKLYVNEVAFMVGFNDVQYFRKCFRKMYHMTPSEYAAQNATHQNTDKE
jgi:signal transduction histidine kinase/ligand-binding sensor domain-containing protein/DNA-binding response OmpR family regulator